MAADAYYVGDTQKEIIEMLIEADGILPQMEIVDRLEEKHGLTKQSVGDSLKGLVKNGYIKKYRKGKGNIIELIPLEGENPKGKDDENIKDQKELEDEDDEEIKDEEELKEEDDDNMATKEYRLPQGSVNRFMTWVGTKYGEKDFEAVFPRLMGDLVESRMQIIEQSGERIEPSQDSGYITKKDLEKILKELHEKDDSTDLADVLEKRMEKALGARLTMGIYGIDPSTMFRSTGGVSADGGLTQKDVLDIIDRMKGGESPTEILTALMKSQADERVEAEKSRRVEVEARSKEEIERIKAEKEPKGDDAVARLEDEIKDLRKELTDETWSKRMDGIDKRLEEIADKDKGKGGPLSEQLHEFHEEAGKIGYKPAAEQDEGSAIMKDGMQQAIGLGQTFIEKLPEIMSGFTGKGQPGGAPPTIYICPSCGTPVPIGTPACPACGVSLGYGGGGGQPQSEEKPGSSGTPSTESGESEDDGKSVI